MIQASLKSLKLPTPCPQTHHRLSVYVTGPSTAMSVRLTLSAPQPQPVIVALFLKVWLSMLLFVMKWWTCLYDSCHVPRNVAITAAVQPATKQTMASTAALKKKTAVNFQSLLNDSAFLWSARTLQKHLWKMQFSDFLPTKRIKVSSEQRNSTSGGCFQVSAGQGKFWPVTCPAACTAVTVHKAGCFRLHLMFSCLAPRSTEQPIRRLYGVLVPSRTQGLQNVSAAEGFYTHTTIWLVFIEDWVPGPSLNSLSTRDLCLTFSIIFYSLSPCRF